MGCCCSKYRTAVLPAHEAAALPYTRTLCAQSLQTAQRSGHTCTRCHLRRCDAASSVTKSIKLNQAQGLHAARRCPLYPPTAMRHYSPSYAALIAFPSPSYRNAVYEAGHVAAVCLVQAGEHQT